MQKLRFYGWISCGLLILILIWSSVSSARAGGTSQAFRSAGAQQEQSASATPISGAVIISVKPGNEDFVNVRSGPGTDYQLLGSLRMGDTARGLGKTTGGDWIQIVWPQGPDGTGWVYSWLVDYTGVLPISVPPSTPTPPVTATIDATLAAQFIMPVPATRLPTFTPPPPLSYPTYTPKAPVAAQGGPAMIYIMIGFGVIGILGILISFARSH